MTITPTLADVSQSNSATRRIAAFRKQFGEGHFYLACHAALPLALTPDLLYCLWANFQRDIEGHLLDIPWIAVTDLLLSSLCETVGYELYEMEVTIQRELMLQLQRDSRFGQERVRELADFVMAYVTRQLESQDLDTRDFAQAQNWRAVAYKKPAEAAYDIATVLAHISLTDSTEWIRMSALLETLADPLSDYPSLLTYAAAMADFLRGNEVEAAAKFGQILGTTDQLYAAGVNLPVPAKMMLTHPESVPQPYHRSPVLLGSLIAGGLISAAILIGVFLVRSPLSGEFFSSPTPPTPQPSNPSPTVSNSPLLVPVSPAASPSPAPQPDSLPDATGATFPQIGTVTGTSAGSRVNVRSSPSTQSNSPHYALVGDRVTVLEQTQGEDGYSWYQVRFASGAEGWVRSDFVQLP